MKEQIKTLAFCAIALALSIVLSFIKIIQLPLGGAVTLLSMLPILCVSCKFGIKWGLLTGFCYSWFQILQGGVFAWGLTPGMLIASLFLDYIIAFTVLGLSGIFKDKFKYGSIVGIAFACILRFVSHFLSGVILWANFDEFVAFGTEWINHPILYSICYNGAYMLPETIFTIIAAIILYNIPSTKKLFQL